MTENIGEILQFGVSGRVWEGNALDIRRMFFDFLKSARKSIVISAFSLEMIFSPNPVYNVSV